MTIRGAACSGLWISVAFLMPLVHAERLSLRDRMAPTIHSNDVRSFDEWMREAEQEWANKNYAAAELAARKALDKKTLSRKARYLLGLSLAAQRRLASEAMANLREAAVDYPDAYLEISRMLMDQGKMDEAMAELKNYLDSGQLRAK
jgi:tetratricopeptide (TPR) repeat protein